MKEKSGLVPSGGGTTAQNTSLSVATRKKNKMKVLANEKKFFQTKKHEKQENLCRKFLLKIFKSSSSRVRDCERDWWACTCWDQDLWPLWLCISRRASLNIASRCSRRFPCCERRRSRRWLVSGCRVDRTQSEGSKALDTQLSRIASSAVRVSWSRRHLQWKLSGKFC